MLKTYTTYRDAAFAAPRRVWLASLGAAAVTRNFLQNEARPAFDSLVKQGTTVERNCGARSSPGSLRALPRTLPKIDVGLAKAPAKASRKTRKSATRRAPRAKAAAKR